MEHFINDYERNGQYTAFPALGIEWQKMESPFMRKALGMQVGAPHFCLHALPDDVTDHSNNTVNRNDNATTVNHTQSQVRIIGIM